MNSYHKLNSRKAGIGIGLMKNPGVIRATVNRGMIIGGSTVFCGSGNLK
jgi:hypothetical protein